MSGRAIQSPAQPLAGRTPLSAESYGLPPTSANKTIAGRGPARMANEGNRQLPNSSAATGFFISSVVRFIVPPSFQGAECERLGLVRYRLRQMKRKAAVA
jgi:hypothetical protein